MSIHRFLITIIRQVDGGTCELHERAQRKQAGYVHVRR